MSKIRINDLARELEVKSKAILDILSSVGISAKTYSSSLEEEEADRVRQLMAGGSRMRSAVPAIPNKESAQSCNQPNHTTSLRSRNCSYEATNMGGCSCRNSRTGKLKRRYATQSFADVACEAPKKTYL